MEFFEKPVFVCGHRKSGTTLVINLFDGLNNAVVYPDDSGFFYLYHPRYSDGKKTFPEAKTQLANVVVRDNLKYIVCDAEIPESERIILKGKVEEMAQAIENNWTENVSMRNALSALVTSFRDIFFVNQKNKKIC